jgi:hypothetical protein
MKLFIINTVRRTHTRTLRRDSTTRHRFTQRICSGQIRLVRQQNIEIRPEFLDTHRVELQRLQSEGCIEVRVGAPNGALFDFGGSDAVSKATVAPAEVPASTEAGEPEAPEEDGGGEEVAELEIEVNQEEPLAEVPDMSWTKTKLLEYVTEVYGLDRAEEFSSLTKREILEKLS